MGGAGSPAHPSSADHAPEGQEHLGVINPPGRIHQHDRTPFLLEIAQLGEDFSLPTTVPKATWALPATRATTDCPTGTATLSHSRKIFLAWLSSTLFVLRGNHLLRRQRGSLFPGHTRKPPQMPPINISSSSLSLFLVFQAGHQVATPAECKIRLVSRTFLTTTNGTVSPDGACPVHGAYPARNAGSGCPCG